LPAHGHRRRSPFAIAIRLAPAASTATKAERSTWAQANVTRLLGRHGLGDLAKVAEIASLAGLSTTGRSLSRQRLAASASRWLPASTAASATTAIETATVAAGTSKGPEVLGLLFGFLLGLQIK
jgi:hypothetical protein